MKGEVEHEENEKKNCTFFFALSLCVSVRPVLAKRMVSDFSEFKQLCESDTKETIELTSDIIVDEPVVIRGEKNNSWQRT